MQAIKASGTEDDKEAGGACGTGLQLPMYWSVVWQLVIERKKIVPSNQFWLLATCPCSVRSKKKEYNIGLLDQI